MFVYTYIHIVHTADFRVVYMYVNNSCKIGKTVFETFYSLMENQFFTDV